MSEETGRAAARRTQVDELLTPRRVHEEYGEGFDPQTAANRRWRGEGPDYIKIGSGRGGRVLYRRSAIEEWLNAQTVTAGGPAA